MRAVVVAEAPGRWYNPLPQIAWDEPMETAHESPNGAFKPGAEARDAAWTSKSLCCPAACLPRVTLLGCVPRKAGSVGVSTDAHLHVADSEVTLPHIRGVNWSGQE
jgi:hypothetical protein